MIKHLEPEHSNKTSWHIWKLPLFGEWNLDTIMNETTASRMTYPGHLIKVIGYDGKPQKLERAMAVAVSMIVSVVEKNVMGRSG